MKTYKIIGLMSGTSLDGLDLAYCHIWENKGTWHFDIKETKSVKYSLEMLNTLKNAISLSAEKLIELHNTYGTWLGEQTSIFINENNLEVDYIASHGHTTHHRPEMGLTFQVGSAQHLANSTGIKVIADFRTNDLALGGQGAPLVPIGDRMFFNEFEFCLNLGGISNISFEVKDKRIAYDIGLANMILNYITRKVDLEYDEDGKLARSGSINIEMLGQLNSLKYYLLPHPKSIGYEWFLEEVVPIVEGTEDTIENLLHTSIHHICDKVAQQIQLNYIHKNQRLLITGGGALNSFLIETLQQKLGTTTKVVVPDKIIIEFKEALVFALMGVLRVEQLTNVLSSVTGAKKDSSSGVLFIPN
ncbi:anhydro-N-acetylmuramic acid kinase [Maribacter hydrothermalis]|uniref:Anhydro-N-acetylmuramic acid kinase n=1 Tax=Maribacter hydrothermalis TaxID=1836467 RepID=A0A1B7ZD98_9FLAO|nr:anhydro-N-acetylmuramic acid kinase [Maribacter hydrothermalis]APQ18465.1 anhydro-N-acetylmuramic acid kinase [Maribacter hydrothermalis]OBR41328.1 anhydro-N-acetylmuramic acid kinase [Maribacter hydrothermalis]